MLFNPINFWNYVSNAGTAHAVSDREKRGVIMLNRAWLILIAIQTACFISHLINGLYSTAMLTGLYIAGLSLVHILMRGGKINAAKITAMVVINYNTVIMAFVLGMHTNIIDFLLLTALMPLYLFEISNRKMMVLGVAISIVPFALYHYIEPYFTTHELPLAQQMMLYKTTTWVKILCLVALLYLIYSKNASYEKEVLSKEQELLQQKKVYERILEQIPIDIVTFDKDLKYSYVNSSAVADEQIRKWLIGKTNLDYFKERNLDLQKAVERDRILKEALQKGKSVVQEETLMDRHGRLKYTLKGASPICREGSKEVLCLIGYSMDITGIKEAEQKLTEYARALERKNEDLQHFVNATSHDLKTPLRIITSNLQLLERKNRTMLDEDSLQLMDYSIKSVKHLNQLISDIYQYSVADRHDKPNEQVIMNNVVDKILRQMEEEATEKKAEIRRTNLPQIKAAMAHMEILFNNLIGNALKYNTSPSPQITIGYAHTNHEYIFSVKDNGIGISEEYRNRIFEIFRRLHSSEKYEGTGVGLAICKKIVENYDGRIWVEGNEGGGSTFYFSLAKNCVSIDLTGQHKIVQPIKLAVA